MKKQESIDMIYPIAMNCPSCDHGEISTTWVNHKFQYGTDENHVMLKCKVPMRTCQNCDEEWLDYVAEDINDRVIAAHLSTVDVTTTEWESAATKAIQDAKAFNIRHILGLMEIEKIAIEDMDEWCEQAREDYLCLFQSNVIGSLG